MRPRTLSKTNKLSGMGQNCAIKPPAPAVLRDRHRRLCIPCQKAPIGGLVKPTQTDDLRLTSDTMQRTICTCGTDAGVWLCQPCGRGIRGADSEYRGYVSSRLLFSSGSLSQTGQDQMGSNKTFLLCDPLTSVLLLIESGNGEPSTARSSVAWAPGLATLIAALNAPEARTVSGGSSSSTRLIATPMTRARQRTTLRGTHLPVCRHLACTAGHILGRAATAVCMEAQARRLAGYLTWVVQPWRGRGRLHLRLVPGMQGMRWKGLGIRSRPSRSQ